MSKNENFAKHQDEVIMRFLEAFRANRREHRCECSG